MESESARVVAHYETIHEEDRLVVGLGSVELARTQEILSRHLPAPPARILDVGGGTGVHAGWLLEAGYAVHLIDLTPRHVERARSSLDEVGLTAEVGDARHLGQADESFDAVLLLGPLYHLQEMADRIAALREARRVLVPGGVVVVAAINRFASLFDGLTRGFIFDPAFRQIVMGDLASGRHVNPDDRPHWFTTAFFHRPEQLRKEILEGGFSEVEVLGVEGLAAWLPHLEAQWADAEKRQVVLETARLIEAEPTLLGLSSHLLAVAS